MFWKICQNGLINPTLSQIIQRHLELSEIQPYLLSEPPIKTNDTSNRI